MALTIAVAAAVLGVGVWFLLRPSRPLNAVDVCWERYRAARTSADTADVDRRHVPVTPSVIAAGSAAAPQPYSCGAWRAWRDFRIAP